MAKKTKKKEFKEVEVINNSKYTLRTKLTDDGEKLQRISGINGETDQLT